MNAASPVAMDQLAAELTRLGPECRVIGFDVFDTLVGRRVEPEWLKTAVARHLWRRLRRILPPDALPSPSDVRRRRGELEGQIAGERVARGEDNEVDFEALVPRWVATWAPEPHREALAALTAAAELDAEERAVFPLPGAAAALRAARGAGRRVIWVSDMYLPARAIWRLLATCGLEGFFDAGYVSTELGVRKATGRLFPRLLELEGVRPEQLLFVGDNPESDCARPAALGIATRLVDHPADRVRRHRLRAATWAVERNPYWSAQLVAEVLAGPAEPDAEPDAGADDRLGEVLAPSLAAFALHVLERCDALDLDGVYFVAREGLVLQRLHRILRAVRGDLHVPPDRYLLLSRASTFLASLRSLSWDDLAPLWWQYDRQSVTSLLRNLSLPAEPFVTLARRCGVRDPDAVVQDPACDEGFQQFLTARPAQAAFRRERDRARALLRSYLERQRVFGRRRIGFVDIGWKGTMQDNVVRAFGDDPAFPEVHGMYLGLFDRGEPDPPRSTKEGFLADTRRRRFEDRDLFRNTAAFEMATTADHGTTVGYRAGRGDPSAAVPILRHHPLEQRNAEQFFRRTQQAIYTYARQLARIWAAVPFDADELLPGVRDAYLRYVRFPSGQEALDFLRYSHVESFGVDKVTTFDLGLDRGALRRPLSAVRELRAAFRRNLWKEAVVRRAGGPLASLVYDIYKGLKRSS